MCASSNSFVLPTSVQRKVSRTSDRKTIISTLEKIALVFSPKIAILTGSRAAEKHVRNFRRDAVNQNSDYDVIISASDLLNWLYSDEHVIINIELIDPNVEQDDTFDLYICCTLANKAIYDLLFQDFVLPIRHFGKCTGVYQEKSIS